MGTTTSRLRVYQFHHLGNTTLHHETRFTFALELEVRQSLEKPTFALEAPAHHLKPVVALALPIPLDLANLLESALELSL